jgi:hypothetical protein
LFRVAGVLAGSFVLGLRSDLVYHVRSKLCVFNWNVRGSNNMARRKVVLDVVRDCRATIVTLQETKLDFIDSQLVMEILGTKFQDNFVVLPAAGTCGGILLAVDVDHYKIIGQEVGVNTVTAKIESSFGLLS